MWMSQNFDLMKIVGSLYEIEPSRIERWLSFIGAWLYKRRIEKGVKGFSWIGYDRGLKWVIKTESSMLYGAIEYSEGDCEVPFRMAIEEVDLTEEEREKDD